jgi:hypothetical protein
MLPCHEKSVAKKAPAKNFVQDQVPDIPNSHFFGIRLFDKIQVLLKKFHLLALLLKV